MKWKKYNKMTKEQKEEYTYRFIDKPIIINVAGLGQTLTVLMSVVTMFMLVQFVILQSNDAAFDALKEQVPTLMKSTAIILQASVYFMLATLGGWVIYITYRKVREYLWLKKLKEEDSTFWKDEQKDVYN